MKTIELEVNGIRAKYYVFSEKPDRTELRRLRRHHKIITVIEKSSNEFGDDFEAARQRLAENGIDVDAEYRVIEGHDA